MAIPYTKTRAPKPLRPPYEPLYYPRLVTLGNSVPLSDVAYRMRERSSLSLGDIQSVLTNFVETMREILFNGQSVNIQGFGIFSLKARTKSAKTPEECGISNIKSVTIRFRPSVSIKPDLACTRAGEQLKFYEVKTQTPADAQAKPTTPTAPAIPAAPAAPEGGNDGNGNVDEEC